MNIDLFSGAGGWDLAALELGIPEPVGIEIMTECLQTRAAADLLTLDTDVLALDPHEFDPVQGLIGSPPCQTFSVAGSGAGRRALTEVLLAVDIIAKGGIHDLAHLDERTQLVVQPLRWALELEPDWIALEQVPTVLPVWQAMATYLREDGYHVWTGVLNAEQYGVPQTRRRAVLMAARWPIAPPVPTHSRFYAREPERLDEGVKKWVSMAEALGWGATHRPSMTVMGGGTDTGGAEPFGNGARQGLEREMAAGRWVMRSNYSASGSRGVTAQERGRVIRTMEQPASSLTGRPPFWAPADAAQPSPTVTPRNSGATRISHVDASVLQTFPAHFPWRGTVNRKYQMIGNAIPVLLAHAILDAIISAKP